jgi:uncharacterized protein (DUF608 family)
LSPQRTYEGESLNRIAFPLGGIGAGMICLEGTGALSHVSLRGHADIFNEPQIFSALCIKGEANKARVLEGPVPRWKAFGPAGTGNGGSGKTYGLPRFAWAAFAARFPFATVALSDPKVPLQVELTGWSPFTPGDADSSSLPVAALEYRFVNRSGGPVEAVYSFHARNFMAKGTWSVASRPQAGSAVLSTCNGFTLWQPPAAGQPWMQGAFSAVVDDPRVKVNCLWFRGGWFDALTLVWKAIREGRTPEAPPVSEGEPSPGGSLYVPFRLEPGEEKVIRLRLAWHVPETNLRVGKEIGESDGGGPAGCCCSGSESCSEVSTRLPAHKPWYASVFPDIEAVNERWRRDYDALRAASLRFSDCFYDTSLPAEVVEAVAANLTILKSPTVLRQTDGRLWCWEGCYDQGGCCPGSCTHVWNYAQALPHLFPDLERSLRETEFHENQDERGHQAFRASLPIRPAAHDFHAAADGQLGGIMKVYREWRISGDGDWLRRLWPRVRCSLEYCVETWDPAHKGVLEEPHHNTYDIEFWGPDGMCTSFYLGALQAGIAMAEAVGDEVPLWRELLARGRAAMETDLWDGEYFIQRIRWEGLKAGDPASLASMVGGYSPEALELLRQEGPKYQYGSGCLSDGVLGGWMAAVCGLGDILDAEKVTSHLLAVHRYNLRHDLSEHANPQRPTYALGKEGGLLLCSWPKGGALSLPFVYSDEVWTGIEYQVASHLMLMGQVAQGLEIVRAARDRYDGRVRNPFNEYECGHWYGRALSSYGLLQGLTGARHDAVERTLYIEPRIAGDWRAFLCTATGYGTVGVRDGAPFVEVRHGSIPYERIVYRPAEQPEEASLP